MTSEQDAERAPGIRKESLVDPPRVGNSVMDRLRRDLEAQQVLTRQLQHALDSRVVIEQAKGILAERHGATVDEAFEAMRSYTRSNRRRLHDVAAEVIDSLASSQPEP